MCRDGQAVEMSFDHKPEDEPEMKRIKNAGGKVTECVRSVHNQTKMEYHPHSEP